MTETLVITYEELTIEGGAAAPANPMDLKRGTVESDEGTADQLIFYTGLEDGGDGKGAGDLDGPPYYDVNGDGQVSALDALRVINYLAEGGGSSAGTAEIEFVEVAGSDDDGGTSPIDALLLINELGRLDASDDGEGRTATTKLDLYVCPSDDSGDYWFADLDPGF